MLDQNTDRMWYVIGAVLIGAAIIFGMNTLLPETFASVKGNFEDIIKEINGIQIVQIYGQDVHPSTYPVKADIIDYDVESGTWTVNVHPNPIPSQDQSKQWSGGLTVREGVVEVPYNHMFTLSYEIKTPVDTWASNDVNNIPVTGDNWSTGSTNDNDHWEKRVNVSRDYGPSSPDDFPMNVIKANEWTTITFSYFNTSPANEDKTSLYDYSTFGAHNPTDELMPVEIRNVHAEVVSLDQVLGEDLIVDGVEERSIVNHSPTLIDDRGRLTEKVYFYDISEPLKPNTEYSLSFDYKSSENISWINVYFLGKNPELTRVDPPNTMGEWKHYEFTFTTRDPVADPNNGSHDGTRIRFDNNSSTTDEPSKLWSRNVTLREVKSNIW